MTFTLFLANIIYASTFTEVTIPMSKSYKIRISIGCAIILVILLTTLIMSTYANSNPDNAEPVKALSSWMSMISSNTKIKNIAIPGSHDAGSYDMPWFAETQDKNITDQLSCGTRYFDLRVQKAGDDLVIYHGISKGVSLEDVIDDFIKFLSAHKTETLLLDFQHFKGEGAQEAVVELLDEKLASSYVVKNRSASTSDKDYISNLTLNSARGKCIIFWGSDSNDALDKQYIFKRNDDLGSRTNSSLHSFYISKLNKGSSANYIANALPTYIDMYNEKGYGLFVLQGQLTDGLYLRGPKFRERTHNDNMNNYLVSLVGSEDLDSINIVMRDYVGCTKNAYCLQLNISKGNLIASQQQAYVEMLANYIDVTATQK